MTGVDLECSWFNVPMAGTGTEPVGTETATEEPTEQPNGTEAATEEPTGEQLGAVEIEYRECPDGYTFLDAGDEDQLNQMLTDCAQVDDVEFTIDQGGPDGNSQLTGFFGESHVSFTEVPTGMRTITQTIPFANTYVTCNGIVQHGGPETGVMDVPASNGAIEWNLLDDEIAFCNWFVAPGAGGATPPSGDGNSVTVYKWLCPEGTAYGMTIDDYSAACDQEHLNIPISLTDANGEHATTTQANGTEWDDVVPVDGNPDDAVFLAEEIPSGFGEPVVFCQALDQDEWRLYESEDGAFTLDDFGADTPWTVQCNWYNLPGEGATPLNQLVGHVNINYWECPQGTDFATITDEQLATDCTGTANGVVFNAISGSFNETQATGDLNDSFVGFSEVPTGTVSVKQVTPPLQLIVICQGIVSNGGPETGLSRLPITQATIEWNLLDDEIVYCDWYVIPTEPGFGSVAINKHACPAGFDAYSADIYELAANCHEDPGTVNFTVTSGAYNQTAAATGGGNYASFSDVPSGSLTVTEALPDGYGVPVVYCKVEIELDLTDVVPTYQASVGSDSTINRLDRQWAPAVVRLVQCPRRIDCWWPSTSMPARLASMPTTADEYELAANCHEDPGTVPFTVTSGGYSETKNASGGGNYASFPAVPAGSVTVTETLPDGYGMPVVYCKVELGLDLTDVIPHVPG